jgi:hypothetical protein
MDKQQRAIRSWHEGLCVCHKCLKERDEVRAFMVVCPECGNKRCPKASDHDLSCTGSNKPGQSGSVYV